MMQATIQTVLANASFIFNGSHATAAIAAVRAHKMIDAMGVGSDAPSGTPATRLQIPYSSVVMAQFQYTPDDTEVEDANCKVRTPAVVVETGTLTLRNPGIVARLNVEVDLMLSEPATYSGIEFSVVQAGVIRGTIPSILAGASFDLEGIPVGTRYAVEGATPETEEGIVPAEVVLVVSE